MTSNARASVSKGPLCMVAKLQSVGLGCETGRGQVLACVQGSQTHVSRGGMGSTREEALRVLLRNLNGEETGRR